MPRSSTITDWFHRQDKRHLPDDSLEKSRAIRPSPSNTPADEGEARQKNRKIKAGIRHMVQSNHVASSCFDGLDHQSQSRSPEHGTTPNGSIEASIGQQRGEMEPLGSQGPILTSSQRVVKNGEVMIRNSDDESDSDASLDDIDDLLVAQKIAMMSSQPTRQGASLPLLASQLYQNSGASTRNRTRGAVRGDVLATNPDLSSSRTALPKYKFSLEALQQRTNHDRASEAGIAKARLLLDSYEKDNAVATPDSNIKSNKSSAKADTALLISVMEKKGEQEDIDRLLTAIRRTEAFDQGKSWSFFDDTQRSSSFESEEFPIPQDEQWQEILSNKISRQQAFLGGYVGDMAAKGVLPDELILWILDAVCLETRDDLKFSYIYALEHVRTRLTLLLTPSRIERLFQKIGARVEALDLGNPINPVEDLLREKQGVDWSNLLSILNLIKSVSSDLSVDSRLRAICILCRLLLDAAVVKNCEVMAAVELVFSTLVHGIPEPEIHHELQALSSTIYPFVTDSSLRLQMLWNIPAHSPPLSLLRRRLALAFLFEDETILHQEPDDWPNLRAIAKHLEGNRFAIRNNTDYAELAMLIGILRIGVDSGDPPLQSRSSSQERAAFHADVDLLTSRINGMFSQIVDSGASHMKRTQAKETLEAFLSQLRFAMRLTPKPKTMMFAPSGESLDQKSLYDIWS